MIKGFKDVGFEGVILGYVKEVVVLYGQEGMGFLLKYVVEEIKVDMEEIDSWVQGMFMIVLLVNRGDYVVFKFIGVGVLVLQCLWQGVDFLLQLKKVIESICVLVQLRGVRLLFDVE